MHDNSEQGASRPRPYFPAKSERKAMVKWFDPRVLLITAMDVVKSGLIGSQLDTRELQIVPEADLRDNEHGSTTPTGHNFRVFDFENGKDEFIFDFMADTGDGWDSTYSVASLLSRDKLNIPKGEESSERISMPRGRFLLIGSDLVYPTASLKEYRQRFLTPFGTAWGWLWRRGKSQPRPDREYGDYLPLEEKPPIYAIPGNHDWYDSLSAFRMRFCNLLRQRKVGEWRTDQSRSYFALKLPEKWCVFGVDIGLDESLDNLQYNYFYNVVKKLDADSRIILLAAEPEWVQGGVQNPRTYDRLHSVEKYIKEAWQEERADEKPPRVWINLTGDTHCYQSYARRSVDEIEKDLTKLLKNAPAGEERKQTILEELKRDYYPRVKFVAGGGGAFLHPTHGYTMAKTRMIPSEADRSRFDEDDKQAEVPAADIPRPEGRYPKEKQSKWLAFKNAMLFLPRNWLLALIFGAVYAVVGWTLNSFLDELILTYQFPAPTEWHVTLAHVPFACIFWLTVVLIAFTFSSDKRWTGFVHGLIQAAAIVAGYVFFFYWLHDVLNMRTSEGISSEDNLLFKLILFGLQFLWGFVFGGWSFAWAFYINLTFYNTDHNNAFGHASIAEFKNFQKYKIERGGRLTVYSIAVPDPVTYSLPEKDEVDPAHWDRLAAAGGEDWNRQRSYARPDDKPLEPKPIRYFLIESVQIDPIKNETTFTRAD